jgi:hypothetical protein
MAMGYKKYYQMGGVVLGALVLYWMVKKNPASTKELILSSNEYIKYLPVDKNLTSFVEPLLDFTAKQSFANDDYPNVISLDKSNDYKGSGKSSERSNTSATPMMGGQQATIKSKRCVSESKKKYIAAQQGWKCKECGLVLPATYEVDHIVRLQHGGSNEIENLQALCPSCHRNKTMMETMSL